MSDKPEVESIDLSTVLQVGIQSPTDKITVVKDQENNGYVSLDETYEVTGQESLKIVAANCREYMKNKRLHPSAFSALLIGGMENLVPAYDRMNAIKGEESFLTSLKAGFIAIIKAAKSFLISVIDWIVLRIRSLLGFEKTERELAIVAEYSDDVKNELVSLLGSLIGAEKVDLDVAEMYEALPGNLTQRDAFTIIHDKNKSIIDQVDTLKLLQTKLTEVETTIHKAGMDSRNSRSRYQQAVTKLRKAFEDKDSFSNADVIEFRAALDQEVAFNLNPEPILKQLSGLIEEAYGIDLGSIGADKAFKQKLTASKDILEKKITVKVSHEEYKQIKLAASQMGAIMLKAQQPLDPALVGALKDTIEIKDADLIEVIDSVFDKAGILKMSYTSYCSSINEYVWALNQLITVSSNIRRSIVGIVNWSVKVDKMLFTYLTKDLNTIINTEQELLNEQGKKFVMVKDADGNHIDSTGTMNYDDMFMAKHPYIATVLQQYRAKTGDLRKNFKIIEKINAGLKKLGVQSRI